ncbi:MAG: spore coat protein CotJB [Ruminococcus flavefaciens]|nr:spore coat protein CotJB [Ruminococcus flavefaciens]MCM1229802.1 spore coat protein CotJB [Ruminococcus flavefaciens]
MNQQALMTRIKQYDFTLKELNLYLDTHPNCRRALAMFQKYRKLREEAVKEYNDNFGPITPEQTLNTQRWSWIDDPFPWEV